MANPPPPINHDKYISQHYTEKVDRYFSKYNFTYKNTQIFSPQTFLANSAI